ncbi:MAG TPA: DUF922 domain-containing protein [Rubricoccaceae bacterium]|jgi:predicted secreted Zn-dependent protease
MPRLDSLTPTLLATAALAILALAVLTLRDGGSGATPPLSAGGGIEIDAARPVRTHISEAPYAVTGATEEAITASMVQAAPSEGTERFFGLTTTELAFRYHRTQTAGGCALRDVRVDLAVTVALPRWTRPPEAPYALARDWSRFETALRRHEDHHRELAEAGAEAVRAELDGLAAPTCAEADAEARRRAERAGIENEAAHRRYDDETGHGQTQGASWPLR